MTDPLRLQTARLVNWLREDAIPLWQSRGIDSRTGASVERLLADGRVDEEAPLRLRVQARQAYFFAAAGQQGWCAHGSQIARGILDFAHTYARHPQAGGGFVHLLDTQGGVLDSKQDLYDHAFCLLAYAWSYRVTGDRESLQAAHRLMHHLDTRFASSHGGWQEGDYAYPCRRQNPHMHLFEAFLALYEASGEAVWLRRAQQVFDLFQTYFYRPQEQVLLEFFTEDWTPLMETSGYAVEPGHMFEWVWLLDWFQRLSGQSVSAYLLKLYHRALALGLTREGLVRDVVTPTGEVLQSSKRCWGLTEYIKANVVAARLGEPEAEQRAAAGVDALFHYYLSTPTAGSYVDRLGANDEVIDAYAPASALYHLMALAQALVRHQG